MPTTPRMGARRLMFALATIGAVVGTPPTPPTPPTRAGDPAPPFNLLDTHGRPVALEGYKGAVVFLTFGATWCGGCQQEAPKLVELERTYADRPVHFFHVVVGENAAQALDFQKHYRSEAGFLLDTNYRVAKSYEALSWPTYVIVDAAGNLAGRWQGLAQKKNRNAIVDVLEGALKDAQGGPPKGAFCTADTCFAPSAADAQETQPVLRADAAGRVHLVYVRERGATGELHHRIYADGRWSEPQRITKTAADHYAPALCGDRQGGLWLVWCSNEAASGKYDVWAQHFDGHKWSSAQAVTACNDDAAHPRAAVDSAGRLWVTYYRWIPWSPGLTRDREVFVRRHDGRGWSDEIQISPTDVPIHEDHTDPSIVADERGNVWVAWVWDTHPNNDWPYPATFGQAMFARSIDVRGEIGPVEMVAVRAPSAKAATKNPHWVFAPELVCREDQPWFLASGHTLGDGRHGVEHAAYVTYREGKGEYPAPRRLGGDFTLVCTPRFVEDRDGHLAALWSAPTGRHYVVKVTRLGDDGQWGDERTVWMEPEADLRFPVGAFDAKGTLVLAATHVKAGKNAIAVTTALLRH